MTNADTAPIATRPLHFDWHDVAGASYYRLTYSVGSGAYRTALDKVPADTSRAVVQVPLHLAARPSLRYAVAACDTAGCGRSSGIRPNFRPFSASRLMCGADAAFAVGDGNRSAITSTDSPGQICVERVTGRFYGSRRMR